MKKVSIIIVMLAIMIIDCSAQVFREPTDLVDKVNINKIVKFDSIEIIGTPFLSDEFVKGTLEDNSNNVYQDILLRYNIYNDNFEFRRDGVSYMLERGITAITARIGSDLFVWAEFTDDGKPEHGYVQVLRTGFNTLYKKHRMAYYPPKPPAPYQESTPAGRFGKMAPSYYIGHEGKILTLINNERALLKLFPAQEDQIRNYIKRNKLKFRKEKDLVNIIKFINEL